MAQMRSLIAQHKINQLIYRCATESIGDTVMPIGICNDHVRGLFQGHGRARRTKLLFEPCARFGVVNSTHYLGVVQVENFWFIAS